MALSKDQILGSQDRATRTEQVPEWCPLKPEGVDVCPDKSHDHAVILRTLAAIERNSYDKENLKKVGDDFEYDPSNIHARLVSKVLVDEGGNRIFNDVEAKNLGAKSAGVLARLFEIAQDMNGLGQKAAEDAKGNSDAAPSGDSSSD